LRRRQTLPSQPKFQLHFRAFFEQHGLAGRRGLPRCLALSRTPNTFRQSAYDEKHRNKQPSNRLNSEFHVNFSCFG
jgi:hypothetical protein